MSKKSRSWTRQARRRIRRRTIAAQRRARFMRWLDESYKPMLELLWGDAMTEGPSPWEGVV